MARLYTIIDIETTGNGIKGNKITEIAIFKFDGRRIVDEFTSLVNPECPIPYFITGLTGIDDQMVQKAPIFSEIASKILELTADCIFVAHAVNFDYGVIKEEFRKIGIDFTRQKLCTVRLGRRLIPNMASYSLGKLCSALDIQITDRHRARGDARATVTLFKKLLDRPNSENLIAKFLNSRSQEATLPPLLNKSYIDRLPQKPGIYYFKNKKGVIIYVGKAKNIKKRVLGHFYDKSRKETIMCSEISTVDFELSGSELIALLMESHAIKTHYPRYNVAQKRTIAQFSLFSYFDRRGILHLGFNRTKLVPNPLATLNNQTDCRMLLKQLCQDFSLCPKYCQLIASAPTCENSMIKSCEGICLSNETISTYNTKVQEAIASLSLSEEEIYIKQPGRNPGEKGLVYIKKGIYQGYAFIDNSFESFSMADIEAHVIKQKNTPETQSIIENCLLKNEKLEVVTRSPVTS